VVCFKRNPFAAESKRYAEAGLVFCTEATLAQMLSIIDLASHDCSFPFTLHAPRSGYSITINPTPNPEYEGYTPEQITAANLTKYEAVVAAHQAAADDPEPF
jgi:hypothetical protein